MFWQFIATAVVIVAAGALGRLIYRFCYNKNKKGNSDDNPEGAPNNNLIILIGLLVMVMVLIVGASIWEWVEGLIY